MDFPASVVNKRLTVGLKLFRGNTYKKQGVGAPPFDVPAVTLHVQLFSSLPRYLLSRLSPRRLLHCFPHGARNLFAPMEIGEEVLAEALACHGGNSVAGERLGQHFLAD